MSGDYSRFPYDPARDYCGVLLQQGRPLTDWDWNDLIAQFNRRAQATSHDLLGAAALVPMTTPDGFKLAVDAAQQLTIGRGRIYVDGLLAENHGQPPIAWDSVLAESYGRQPVPYLQQPYLPNAPALPTTGGPYLIYLDVWQREVTRFEAPGLVDKAMGGVDTTTRLQTVWQVKWLGNDKLLDLSCNTDLANVPGWAALTRPSAGRLSTGTAAYGTDNPCLIPPTGGYTGLENQLYRVEIHDGGAPGTATFKWSRDNATVETRVTRFVDASTLVVESVGKDGVLRFNDGDWIEILDDWLELNNQPGELHRIAIGGGVDDATRTITLEKPITVNLFPVDSQGIPVGDRHLRIKRWDQNGQVLQTNPPSSIPYFDLSSSTSAGAIPVPNDGAVQLSLESGIVVSFDVSSSGGVFKSGDWWVIAARAADASIEVLVEQPPRGIHHHFARLGVLTPGSQPTDCRQFWPPSSGSGESCACTVCVSPRAHAQGTPSLQQAINTVIKSGGGTVCMEAGVYVLDAPLEIASASTLTLRGQGFATRLLTGGGAILIDASIDVALEDFTIACKTAPAADFASVTATKSQDLRLQRLSFESATQGTGPVTTNSPAGIAIALVGSASRVRVSDNRIAMAFGIYSSANTKSPSQSGAVMIDDLMVEGNAFRCSGGAIDLLLDAKSRPPVRIHNNKVTTTSGHGIALSGNSLDDEGVEISGNRIDVSTNGISADIFGLRILDNDISNISRVTETTNHGIWLPGSALREGASAGDCHLTRNSIAGFSGTAILVEAPIVKAQIKQNQLARCGGGIEVIGSNRLTLLSIENNQISDLDMAPDTKSPSQLVGISVIGAPAVSIAGNTIFRIGLKNPSQNLPMMAVMAQGCDNLRVSGNELCDIGPAEPYLGTVVAILARAPLVDVLIDDNRLCRSGDSKAGDAPKWFGIVIAGAQAAITGTATSGVNTAVSAVIPEALQPFLVSSNLSVVTSNAVSAVSGTNSRVIVHRNQVTANGGAFAALISAPICDFSNNQCLVTTLVAEPTISTTPGVLLSAQQALVVSGNRVSTPPKRTSMALATQEGHYTVLGNVTTGAILVQNNPLAAQWALLNITSA